MAAITPSTNLKLLKNINNLSSQNQLTFANATAQYNYFNSLTKIEVDDFTYQRKDYTIRYKACIDDILDYNYVMYQNSTYSNKWFYAYITNMRWLNDSVTEITIKTDVYQSFMFDITFKASFVEREHVSDDTIGKNVVPENLETGDYISTIATQTNFGRSYPVLMVTEYCKMSHEDVDPYDMKDENRLMSGGKTIYGIYNGCEYLICGDDYAVQSLLGIYSKGGKIDSIVGMFMMPEALTDIGIYTSWYYTSGSAGLEYGPFLYLGRETGSLPVFDMNTFSIGKPYNNIAGVVPVNNKLYTYPYIYLLGTNNVGVDVIYQYEYFNDPEEQGIYQGYCRFNTRGVICPGCSIKTTPMYYKGIDFNYSEGIPLGKYPICSYNTDMYTNWLTQNSVNTAVSLVTSSAQIVAGGVLASTGAGALAGAGQIASGLTGIASTLGTIYQHSLMPPQAQGDVNTGDVTYTQTGNNFTFYKMCIRPEMVRVIDSFFSMYGYKVSTVKVPNITGRLNWNYVKCIDANIEGLIPEFYMDEIKSIFNSGVTLWHNPSTFLDYTQSNTIVS